MARRATPVGQRSSYRLVSLYGRRRAVQGGAVPRASPPRHSGMGSLGRYELRRPGHHWLGSNGPYRRPSRADHARPQQVRATMTHHRSRLSHFVIDCDDLDRGVEFWSAALDATEEPLAEESSKVYRRLRLPDSDIRVLLQRTD